MTQGSDFPEFDVPVDRRGTASKKWDLYRDQQGYRDVLPLWVADMEFPAPRCVLDALHARVDHGIFGYTRTPDSLVEAVVAFLANRYSWDVAPEWLVWLPGVVPGLELACAAVGTSGDKVLTPVPVYHPFLSAPGHSDRVRTETPLCRDGARWVMDLDHIEASIDAHTALFMLCNPQNPTGRVYEPAELEALADLLDRRGVTLLADEIHAELVFADGVRHVPVASLSPAIAERTITLMAATKTYNIPGLSCAFAVIPDAALRRRFKAAGRGLLAGVGPLAYTASEAAWRQGEPWRQRMLAVLRRNESMLRTRVEALPGLAMTPVQATCLAWIDARGTGLADPHAHFERAGLGLSPGPQFGGRSCAGDGYVHFNFGCAESMLREAIERLEGALEGLP